MTESLVNEWLIDCANYTSSELHTFARTLAQDNEIVRALHALLDERSKYSELVDTVCEQLFNFYRSREIELQRFTLQFVPTLMFIYLNSVAHGDIKNCRSVETLLIGLYNLEVVDEFGEPKTVSFRLPSLAMLSVYHEPLSLAPASYTESAVRRFEECNSKFVGWGPMRPIETLNAQNRLKVMTAILFVYNRQISYVNKSGLEQFCKVATKLVTQGFTKPGHHQRSSYGSESSFVPRLLPRIPVSNQFLLEFLHGIYYAMYNDCWHVGCQATEDVHNRACYDGYPDVMLVTNAIRNSSLSRPSGQSSEGPMGISVALSPATATATVSKSMITNASFRTKKLPDDIPIQVSKDEAGGEGKANLVSITEEQENAIQDASRGSSIRQSREIKDRGKIGNFSLGKKPRDKDGKSSRNVSSDKDGAKKGNSQTIGKDGTNEINGTAMKKRMATDGPAMNNSVTSDAGLLGHCDVTDQQTRHGILSSGEAVNDNGAELETSVVLKSHMESDSHGSTIQISTV